MAKRPSLLPAFVLLLGCAFTWNARTQSSVPLAAPLAGVLPELVGYRIVEQYLSDEERRIAGMSSYVARVYLRDSTPAFTTLVSYYDRQTRGATIHSPRNCLPGAGWEVLNSGTRLVKVDGATHRLNRYLLKNGSATAVVYYWYQGRGRVVSSEYEVKWNLLRDAALAGHTEEALVRVVVPVAALRDQRDSAEATRVFAAADSLGTDIAARMTRDVARVLPRV